MIESNWQRRIDQFEVALDADQTEWAAIRWTTINIDEGIRDDGLGGKFNSTAQKEEYAAAIADELRRRASILSGAYPFRIEGNGITYQASDSRVYEFCLSINFVPSVSHTEGKRYQVAFERLTRDVVSCYLGRNGVKSYRTGMPGDSLEARPQQIKDIVELIRKQAGHGEWAWVPEEGFPETPANRDLGDLGMDVVAWKEIGDSRGGNLFVVGQCACGLTDWDKKLDEPNRGRLASWIRKISDVPFVKLFAVPFCIPEQAHLGEITRQVGGLVLDRTRIVSLAEARGNRTFIQSNAPEPYSTLAHGDSVSNLTAVRARMRR